MLFSFLEELKSEYIKLDGGGKAKKIVINSAYATYDLYALAEDSIPKFEVESEEKIDPVSTDVDGALPAAEIAASPLPASAELSAPIGEAAGVLGPAVMPQGPSELLPPVESGGPVPTAASATEIAVSVAPEIDIVVEESRSDMWACQICTFLNDVFVDNCTMCGMPNEAGGVEALADHSAALPATGESEGVAAWWCSRCTFMNPLSRTA
jgi:hypothetical protein